MSNIHGVATEVQPEISVEDELKVRKALPREVLDFVMYKMDVPLLLRQVVEIYLMCKRDKDRTLSYLKRLNGSLHEQAYPRITMMLSPYRNY